MIRVMIHQPIGDLYPSRIEQFVMDTDEILKLRDIITGIYAKRTGKPSWIIEDDMERDVFMSAREARAHGLVDFLTDEEGI